MSETTVDIETPDGRMRLFEAAPVDPVARGAVIVVLADLGATLAQLRRKGFADRGIGAVGFCVGGRFAFLAAAQWRLAAAVTFYGGGIMTARSPRLPSLIDRAGSLRTPWLGLFGDRDTVIPVEDVERLRAAVAGAPVSAEIHRYPEAGHGFHCDERPSFHARSALDGWTRTLTWFADHLSLQRD